MDNVMCSGCLRRTGLLEMDAYQVCTCPLPFIGLKDIQCSGILSDACLYLPYVQRWIQQAQDESGLCSGGLEDGTESTSSHQSNSSSSTPNPFKAGICRFLVS